MLFGEFVRHLRIKQNLGLREFCARFNHDPSTWSKMERGLVSPPSGRVLLEKLANQLDLSEGTDDWYLFFDLAHTTKGKIPSEFLNDQKVMELLPVFFRGARDKNLTDEELESIIKLIKR